MPSEVVRFLAPYPAARLRYLELLVYEVHSTSSEHHTQLAMEYIAAAASTEDGLQRLLRVSEHYDAEAVLAALEPTSLHFERALVLGRRGEHAHALSLIVHRVGSAVRAEQYCWDHATSWLHRQELFLHLLKAYLVPQGGHEPQPDKALQLLNGRADLDVAAVLEVAPASWSIGVLGPFLRLSIRRMLSRRFRSRIEHGLARQENLQLRCELMSLTVRPLVLSAGTCCCGCGKPLAELATVALGLTGALAKCSACGAGRLGP